MQKSASNNHQNANWILKSNKTHARICPIKLIRKFSAWIDTPRAHESIFRLSIFIYIRKYKLNFLQNCLFSIMNFWIFSRFALCRPPARLNIRYWFEFFGWICDVNSRASPAIFDTQLKFRSVDRPSEKLCFWIYNWKKKTHTKRNKKHDWNYRIVRIFRVWKIVSEL